MISLKIDFEFDDFVFILIAKFLIASLKSVTYNEVVIIFKTLFISNLILYFFFFFIDKISLQFVFEFNKFAFFFFGIVIFLVALRDFW